MKLVIGLGNPGEEYRGTRHNAGSEALDRFINAHEAKWTHDAKRHAMVCKLRFGETDAILAKPLTFMNESGKAVQSLAGYYKVAPSDILIVQDEMDLAPGQLAFLAKGSNAGHNGIADIQEKMGTIGISRLRLGVGRPTPPMAKEAWVLGRSSKTDGKMISETMDRADEAIVDWIEHGLTKAMNRWNGSNPSSLPLV